MSLFPLKAIALNVVYIPAVKHAPVTFYLREKHIHLYTESHLEGEILLFFQATAHVIRSATFCLFFWVGFSRETGKSDRAVKRTSSIIRPIVLSFSNQSTDVCG